MGGLHCMFAFGPGLQWGRQEAGVDTALTPGMGGAFILSPAQTGFIEKNSPKPLDLRDSVRWSHLE